MPDSNGSSRAIFLANFNGVAEARAFIWHYITHPFYIAAILFPPFLRATGSVGQELPHLGLWPDIAYFILRIAIYTWVMYLGAGWWYLAGLRRNIPFLLVHHGLFLALSLASWAITLATMDTGLSWAQIFEKLLRHQVFASFISIFVVLQFEKDIRRQFGKNPDWVPIWWPVRIPDTAPLMAKLIDPNIAGNLRAIRAQNQYILVETDEGSTLLRRTLSSAVSALPKNAGMLTHRTTWVASSALAEAALSADGARLTIYGSSYPIGRGRRRDVMAALNPAPQQPVLVRTAS